MTVIQTRPLDRDVRPESKAIPRPPCAQRPDDWDLDTGTPESWRQAVQICHRCPLLTQCQRMAAALTESGDRPRAMIWAGVGYDNSGRAIQDLDRHCSTPVDSRRPTRIVRSRAVCTSGSAESQTTRRDSDGAIQRRIVLGRGVVRRSDTDDHEPTMGR